MHEDSLDYWEEELFIYDQTMSTYLRCYKLLKKEQEIFREIQVTYCLPVVDAIVKQTLQMRQTTLLSGPNLDPEHKEKEPIQHFFEEINK